MASLASTSFLLVFTGLWIFVLTSGAKSSSGIEIQVKTGENVTLQCRSTRGADVTLIEWTRPEDLKEEIFVWRNGKVINAQCHESYRGRVELKDPEMKDGDVSVILKNVNINDTGTYECRVEKSEKPLQLINLTVVEPDIKGKPGADVTLQCKSPRDAEILLLRWSRPDLGSNEFVIYFRQNRLNEDYQHERFRGRVNLRDPNMKNGDASVILENANINDTGTYECYVGYGGKTELINTINLTVEPGHTEGHKDGGDEDGGDKSGGDKDGGDKDGGDKSGGGKDGGDKSGGDKDGGNKDGGGKDGGGKGGGGKGGVHLVLLVSLMVVIVLLLLVLLFGVLENVNFTTLQTIIPIKGKASSKALTAQTSPTLPAPL